MCPLQKVRVHLSEPHNHVATSTQETANTLPAGSAPGAAGVIMVHVRRFDLPAYRTAAILLTPEAFPVLRAKAVLMPQGIPFDLIPVRGDPL